MNILKNTEEKMAKTAESLKYNRAQLKKFMNIACHPESSEFSRIKQHAIFVSIGRAVVNIDALTALREHQLCTIKAIKRNDFLVCPLVALIKILKWFTGDKRISE